MKKFYVLLSVMVLALMTAGFSYAYWTDTLTVNGTAHTGSFGVVLVLDEEQDDLPLHVAELNAAITQEGRTLTVELDNLYPGTSYTYTGYVDNVGTIPAILLGITPNDTSDPEVVFDFVLNNVTDVDGQLATDETWTFTLTISVPADVTDHEGYTGEASYTLDFAQFNWQPVT